MKYVLWYSVPFIGKKSTIWSKFRDKILYVREDLGAGVLDPRFEEVRDYLISTYEKALLEWDVDGFKLDFVDDFKLPEGSKNFLTENSGRDYESLQEAVDRLLTDVMRRLKKIKPDIMIEFRQKYIGPYMRKYGNMFRVEDCPAGYIDNRVGILDLRLLSGNTAVHSDMLMWSPEDSVEHAALQMINVLFGVPQISIRHMDFPVEHLEMVRYWLGFWMKNREILLDGKLKPLFPDMQYPIVIAENNGDVIIAVYGDMVIEIVENFNKMIIVNGAMLDRFVLKIKKDLGNKRLAKYDCCGNLMEESIIFIDEGLMEIEIYKSGLVILQ